MTSQAAPDSVWDIERNDIDTCIAFYEQRGVTNDEGAVMIQLQDDPTQLLEVMKGWKSSAA